MTPLMLRQLWSLIEQTQASTLLSLDDSSLVHWLMRALGAQRSFDRQEADTLRSYIFSRLNLIRELAQQR
jgi:hypothetical protein